MYVCMYMYIYMYVLGFPSWSPGDQGRSMGVALVLHEAGGDDGFPLLKNNFIGICSKIIK
ncbi:hypothetical protein, partial [Salmonella enterica]|uniref:hypothetical protein n=1 Tax=Salmonella enterica TaxID=28901 RepID=UPI003526069E